MSVFDRRPLRTNICKYANLISLFSSHWTIRTMAWTWQKLLCRGGVNGKQMVTLHAWNVTLCLQSAGKNHQTKTRARSTRLCLEENQKTNLDPPYVCPKLQVQATFYCQHLLLRNWFHFPFLKSHFPLKPGARIQCEYKYVYFIQKRETKSTTRIVQKRDKKTFLFLLIT